MRHDNQGVLALRTADLEDDRSVEQDQSSLANFLHTILAVGVEATIELLPVGHLCSQRVVAEPHWVEHRSLFVTELIPDVWAGAENVTCRHVVGTAYELHVEHFEEDLWHLLEVEGAVLDNLHRVLVQALLAQEAISKSARITHTQPVQGSAPEVFAAFLLLLNPPHHSFFDRASCWPLRLLPGLDDLRWLLIRLNLAMKSDSLPFERVAW